MLSDFMEKELKKSEKIEFELSVLAMNYPERIERILKNIDPCGHKKYLMKRVSEYLYKKSESGEINPKKRNKRNFSLYSFCLFWHPDELHSKSLLYKITRLRILYS